MGLGISRALSVQLVKVVGAHNKSTKRSEALTCKLSVICSILLRIKEKELEYVQEVHSVLYVWRSEQRRWGLREQVGVGNVDPKMAIPCTHTKYQFAMVKEWQWDCRKCMRWAMYCHSSGGHQESREQGESGDLILKV
jgi:hypothetical protein